MPRPRETPALNADLGRVLGDLDRYAGWLGRGVEPTRVRDDVKALLARTGLTLTGMGAVGKTRLAQRAAGVPPLR